MTIEILLTQGQIALIDDEDYELVSQYKWYASYDNKTKSFYARTAVRRPDGRRTSLSMHRLITKLEKGNPLQVDHLKHNTLDNRKESLKIGTCQDNSRNKRKQRNNTSGYIGVYWQKRDKKWMAYIKLNNKMVYLGYFNSKHDAARRYNEVAAANGFLVLNEIKE